MSTPPPLPPGPSRSDQMVEAFARRDTAARPAPSSGPPPKQGMSGCTIALIVGAVAAVVAIPVIAILAAIAIPAYQDYLARTRVVQSYHMALPLQAQIDAHREQSGGCPDNAAIGLRDDEIFDLGGSSGKAPPQASVLVGEVEGGRCAIELRFANIGRAVDGQTLLLEAADGGWNCYGGTLGVNPRPPQCRRADIFTQTESTP